MRPSNLFERLLSRLESKMIRIVETEVTSRLGQLFGCKTLERGLGCNGHEHGEQYGAMGQRQD